MKYGAVEITAMGDDDLRHALSTVASQRTAFQKRIAEAPPEKIMLVSSQPGQSFLDVEAALLAEKARRNLV